MTATAVAAARDGLLEWVRETVKGWNVAAVLVVAAVVEADPEAVDGTKSSST